MHDEPPWLVWYSTRSGHLSRTRASKSQVCMQSHLDPGKGHLVQPTAQHARNSG